MCETAPIGERVTIERRFRGPPESANGGYACGLVARSLDATTIEATLRAPPPLERPLELELGPERSELRDGKTLVVTARPVAGLELTQPEPVSAEAAAQARRDSPLHEHHAFPGCFVCGPDRQAGDGLGVVPGPVRGRDVVAAPWEVETSLPLRAGHIAEEIIWAVLDCPSGNALLLEDQPALAVLGRLTAEIEAPIEPGSDCVAIGWLRGRDGRKLHTASAILDGDGRTLARAQAVWVELRAEEREAWA